jgi:hypothetical protein
VCVLLQVYVGRQHHLAVEIGGQQFELTLNNQPTDAANAGDHGSPIQHKALPMPQVCDARSMRLVCAPEPFCIAAVLASAGNSNQQQHSMLSMP